MWFFTDEEKELQQLARDFANKELAPLAAQYDQEQKFNLQAFKKMGEVGLLGITADTEYGGSGMGAMAATIVMEEFGKVCASSTLSYLAHSILCVHNMNQNASKEQKEKFLPKLISGEHIGCMGMTEPEHGSDAIGMEMKAKLNGDHYELTGSKTFITNAPYADISYVYARTGKEKKDLTTFIVEKGTPGFAPGKEIHKMGMRASPTGELVFDKAKVPVSNRVGEEGDSTYHMLKNLDIERITISGISLGIAESSLQDCIKYADERKQFGKSLKEFQLIQKMVAEMAAETEMMRHFLYSTCKEYDEGKKTPLGAAFVKLAIPKRVTHIALDAIQLHGGYGYSSEFPLERYMRDAKLMEIGAGTNEVMITIIAKRLLNLENS